MLQKGRFFQLCNLMEEEADARQFQCSHVYRFVSGVEVVPRFCIWCFDLQNSLYPNPAHVLRCKMTCWTIPLALSMLHLPRAASCHWTRCPCYLHRAADRAVLWSGKNSERYFLAFKCPSCLVGGASCLDIKAKEIPVVLFFLLLSVISKKGGINSQDLGKVIFIPSGRKFFGKFRKFLLQKCYLDAKETFCRFVKSNNFKLSRLLFYVIFFLMASWGFFWQYAIKNTARPGSCSLSGSVLSLFFVQSSVLQPAKLVEIHKPYYIINVYLIST